MSKPNSKTLGCFNPFTLLLKRCYKVYSRSFLARPSGKTYVFSLTVSSIDNRLSQSCFDVVIALLLIHFWSGKLDHWMFWCFQKISLFLQGCFWVVDQRCDSACKCPRLCSWCCLCFLSRWLLLSILFSCAPPCLEFVHYPSLLCDFLSRYGRL